MSNRPSEGALTEAERETVARLFGFVPEPEPLELMLTAVARIKAEAVQAERERLTALRDEIQRRRQLFRGHKAHPQYLLALDDAYGLAANACRDAARGEGR